jgi:UDP-N-acetylmuramoylalanine--D-glutamate ligase
VQRYLALKTHNSKTLENFKGVAHRLELVREINGIKFYNDSKATNVNLFGMH